MILGGAGALLGTCGPFTDTANDNFCPFVLEIFYVGITTGTTPTTYDPTASVSRLQMAALLSRAVDGVFKRGSRRAALAQFATPQTAGVLAQTTVDFNPDFAKFDGADVWVSCDSSPVFDGSSIWVPNTVDSSVSVVRASNGSVLQTPSGSRTRVTAPSRWCAPPMARFSRCSPATD